MYRLLALLIKKLYNYLAVVQLFSLSWHSIFLWFYSNTLQNMNYQKIWLWRVTNWPYYHDKTHSICTHRFITWVQKKIHCSPLVWPFVRIRSHLEVKVIRVSLQRLASCISSSFYNESLKKTCVQLTI